MSEELRKRMLLNSLKKVETITEVRTEEESDKLSDLVHINKIRDSKLIKGNKNEYNKSEYLTKWDEFFQVNERTQLNHCGYDFNYYYSLPTSLNAPTIPIFIFHHGAGSSALTFANLCKQLINKLDGKCGCFAFDARGHGQTRISKQSYDARNDGNFKKNDSVVNFDRESFTDDFTNIITYFVTKILSNSEISSSKISIILVGHSLGGSICTHSLNKLPTDIKNKVIGIAMLDIVEEAAIKALKSVNQFLSSTPNVFNSYREAIDWHISHDLSKLKESAEISIPALFTNTKSGKIVRITNLTMFTPFWDTWFTGLSHEFVNTTTSKLLILAGNDNLDKELIVGQMQGKYQLVVFQESGHFIQEDAPLKTALTLIDFWKRNDNKNIVIKSNWGKH